jgi:hypothetical protein
LSIMPFMVQTLSIKQPKISFSKYLYQINSFYIPTKYSKSAKSLGLMFKQTIDVGITSTSGTAERGILNSSCYPRAYLVSRVYCDQDMVHRRQWIQLNNRFASSLGCMYASSTDFVGLPLGFGIASVVLLGSTI